MPCYASCRSRKAYPEFDDPNSPTHRVGSDATNEFRTVEHRYPMLSLSNTLFARRSLHEFDVRIRKEVEPVEYVCSLKFDGTAISLTYQDGRLSQAVTRGDGTRGDDVTANVGTIRTVPLRLAGDDYPSFFEIRGEVLMPFRSFERLNREREDIGRRRSPIRAMPPPGRSNNRARRKPPAANSTARCMRWSATSAPFETHYESLQAARRWGI